MRAANAVDFALAAAALAAAAAAARDVIAVCAATLMVPADPEPGVASIAGAETVAVDTSSERGMESSVGPLTLTAAGVAATLTTGVAAGAAASVVAGAVSAVVVAGAATARVAAVARSAAVVAGAATARVAAVASALVPGCLDYESKKTTIHIPGAKVSKARFA